jgi:hypothetical protein
MKYAGTIVRIQRSRAGVTLIVETDVGLRGVDLDQELWAEVRRDFDVTDESAMIGWAVTYDPAHGDLEITGPADDPGDDDPSGTNDHQPPAGA